jgi:hypothetical protein
VHCDDGRVDLEQACLASLLSSFLGKESLDPKYWRSRKDLRSLVRGSKAERALGLQRKEEEGRDVNSGKQPAADCRESLPFGAEDRKK